MQTQIVAGRVYDFSHAVGRSAVSGMGFTHPVAVAASEGDLVYVVEGWSLRGPLLGDASRQDYKDRRK